ncbi:serine-arginine protein 55-like [Cylas formicarius]|uniref:serine-arginine protein 55-like n=1 Tax=Cylas formicarius TaxID=197179 RepID=UPI002958450A|nr:serine-arginine protein 55-like [Cylas formicarius]
MSTRVFVGGLTYKIRERDIEKFFRKYGRIREVSMKNGYAFVEFEDHRDAEDAVYEMNGKELMGDRVTVERARGTPRGSDRWRDSRDRGGYGGPPRGRDRDRDRDREPRGREKYGPPTRTEYRVVIENLSSRCSWQDLKDYMRKAGEVTYADAHKQTPNEGVVEFASYNDMKNAIEKLDDTEVNGRRIRVIEASKAAKRSRSHSRNRSRSRSQSGRRSNSPKKSTSRSRSRSRNGRSRSRSKENDDNRSKSRSRSNDRT